jgi:cell division FtsZ-interacting protein ZapD
MLRNQDLNKEIEDLIESGHWVKTDLLNRMGLKKQYYRTMMNRPHVDQKIVEMLDIMGYDVEVKFVRKKR